MKQKYYTIIFIALQVLFMLSVSAAPCTTIGSFPMDEVSLEKEISIKVSGNEVRILNASGKKLEIYSVTGKRISITSIDSNDKTITLPTGMRGIYILKVDTVTKPISFK